jgi:hypothetical protein
MLTPLGTLLPHDLQDRGRRILDTLQGLPLEEQLDLVCRTILAVLLTFQPDRSAPTAKRNHCVSRWLMGSDLLPRLDRVGLKEAVASELWPRN